MTPDAATPEHVQLHEFIARRQRFLLTTHVNPDGDAIGSEVAFARWLRAMGKDVRILNDSPTPYAFRWLTAETPTEQYDEALAEQRFSEAEALVVLDTGNRQRIGRLSAHLDRHAIAIAIVDHHVSHEGFGQVNVIEPESAALSTDTGNFRYSNTDASAHRMAAELVERGVDPAEIHVRIHQSAPAGRLRFFGEVLASLQMLEGGQLVVLEATPEQFTRHGLVGADTEGLVDMPRAIEGVEVVALISEVDPGKVKVSLRSTGRLDIDKICSRLGGGGHPHAAGVQIRGDRENAKAKILPEISKLLAALPPEGAPDAKGAPTPAAAPVLGAGEME